MIEVEIKLPLKNRQRTEKELIRQGFTDGYSVQETDTYFNSETFELRKTGMALRVRCCENRTTAERKTFITYKGVKIDPVSMTRKELETEVADAQICREILNSIGFHEIGTVAKMRQHFQMGSIDACVDQVEGLGDFLELEILIEKEEEKEQALCRMEDILKRLGYEMKDTVRKSYLSMLGL